MIDNNIILPLEFRGNVTKNTNRPVESDSLNEAVYFGGKLYGTAVGNVKEFVGLSESEVGRLVYQRLNRNAIRLQVCPLHACLAGAREIRERLIDKHPEYYPAHKR